ncbi:MAG: hypothetical protein II060_10060, partial [Bacteroidales bacterium]|nr:hypothetical protein [Bacteroidales bacterium]
MMKTIYKIIVALVAIAVMISGKAWGQTTATIGTGTSTGYYPMPGFYGWQYDVYLYTPSAASFLNNACTISSIAYYVSSGSTNSAQMTIWVKDVDLTSLSTSSTFSDFTSGATQVYSGSRTTSNGAWNTYTFSSSFSHQAGKALLVAVKGVGCSTSGGCSRNCQYTSASNTHWYKHADGSTDPGTSATGTVDGNRSNIQVTYTAGGSSSCTPSFNSTTSDYISGFVLGNISNTGTSQSTNGYGNYTNMSTSLAQGATATAQLTSYSGSGTHAAAIWIDFNNDGTFDSSEKVGSKDNINPS